MLLIPLYLYYIGAHTYGLWLASGGILGMLAMMNFGISSMLIQRVSRSYSEKDFERTGAYFFNGMIVYLVICLLFGLVGWAVSEAIPLILKVAGDDAAVLQGCFLLAVVAMVVAILNECLRSFSQALLRPVVPMIAMAIGRIIGIAVTIWMLYDGFALWSIPIGTVVGECIIGIVSCFHAALLFRQLKVKIRADYQIIREYVRTSPALLMARMGDVLSRESEPLLITVFLSPEVTAAYMITRKAADMVFQVLGVLYGASHSSFSHLAGEENLEKTWAIASKLLLITFASSLLGFATYVGLNESFVGLWVGKEFALDHTIVFLIGCAFFVCSLRAMVWQLLNGLGDFVYTSSIIVGEGVSRIALMFIGLSAFGVVGVPCALLLSCLLSLVFLGLRLKKTLYVNVDMRFMINALFTVVVLFGSALLISQSIFISESWGMFVMCAVLLFGTLMVLMGSLNYRMCMAYLKKGVL
ncbi:lipopolysaccharide biosynthesis protein [Mariprofundus sp. EBB-1]|uniref:lipopolysaccharide biosynthesis protein n=1 Tax=Mariprofundus sp. EBB-1 TaxID=2650971 RepID=UPI00137B4066|nr:oligosaccharide flippase family protein [Mariprofundus sp. EBB-1]